MKGARLLAVLAGLLVLLPVVLHPPHARADAAGQPLLPPFATDVKQENRIEPATSTSARDMLLRHQGEAAARKAASLRRQQTGKSLRAALSLLEKAAYFFRAGHDNGRASDSYIEIGEIHSIFAAYEKALASYQESVRLAAEDLSRSCRARSRMARTYASMGKSSDADSSIEQILNSCHDVSDRDTVGETQLAQGEVLYFSGKSRESVNYFKEARESFAQVNNSNGEAKSLLLMAYAQFGTDRIAALRFADEALRLWSSPLNQQGMAQVREAFGIFAATLGEFETAQCNCTASLKIFHDLGDRNNEAIVLNILGKVSRETGDLQASLEKYWQAKAAFASIGDQLGEAEAITGIGAALTAQQKYQPLVQLYQEKLRIANQAKHSVLIASALVNLADVYRLKHRYDIAETLYRRSLASYQSKDHPYGAGDALIRLAYLEAEQGRDADAMSLLDSARVLRTSTGQVEELASIDYELAFIYRRMGRLEDALAAIERTINTIESQRLQIASFDSRAAYFAAVHRYYSLYIQVLMALHKEHPEKGLVRRAFEASERSKARSLLDLLTISSQNSPCNELLQSGVNPHADGQDAGNNEGKTSTPSVLNLEQIQAEIQDDDTVLLEYALGDEKSYVWVIDRNHIVSYELPQSERLSKLVKSFLGGLTPPQPQKDETASEYSERILTANRAFAMHAKELSQLLVGQASLPPEKRVLIVPDGFLQYLPFSALPLSQAGERNATLLTRHEVVVLPSASTLAALRTATEKRPPPTSGIAVLADPVFQPNQAKSTSSTPEPPVRRSGNHSPALNAALRDIQGSRPMAPLPGSRQEANDIHKVFGRDVSVILGYDANRESVLHGLIAHYRVVHFATHGMIDVRHPEMSGLVLSMLNRQGKPQDGYLRLGDIYRLKLSADLVVLSSCESALGKQLESEGIIGLPRGFLYAGARSVIASLWKVDDKATAALMARFYERIRQSQTVGAALRGAQLDMAKDRRYSQPNWWAAFVLLGDYQYKIEFKTGL